MLKTIKSVEDKILKLYQLYDGHLWTGAVSAYCLFNVILQAAMVFQMSPI